MKNKLNKCLAQHPRKRVPTKNPTPATGNSENSLQACRGGAAPT